MPEVGVSSEVGVLLEDHLPVKFKDPKLKNENFVRIDMKHSYFSNYLFAMFLKLLLFAKILFMFMHNSLYCCIMKFKMKFNIEYVLIHKKLS